MNGGLNLRVTTLDKDELTRVRALIAEQPPIEPGQVGRYPQMLYHSSYGEAQTDWRKNPDELQKKTAAEKMKTSTVIVFDAEEELEFLEDGWKRSPADFMAVDPRVPVGREAKRAAAAQALSRDDEILMLQRRLAELRGTPVFTGPKTDDDPTPVRTRKPRTVKGRRPTRAAALAAARLAVQSDAPPAESIP